MIFGIVLGLSITCTALVLYKVVMKLKALKEEEYENEFYNTSEPELQTNVFEDEFINYILINLDNVVYLLGDDEFTTYKNRADLIKKNIDTFITELKYSENKNITHQMYKYTDRQLHNIANKAILEEGIILKKIDLLFDKPEKNTDKLFTEEIRQEYRRQSNIQNESNDFDMTNHLMNWDE